VIADDVLTEEGAVARLSLYQEIAVQTLGAERAADVVLMLATVVTGNLLNRLEQLRHDHQKPDLPVVLVADELPEHSMLRAINCGVVSLLRRDEMNFNRIVRNIVAVVPGHCNLSRGMQGHLLQHMTIVRDRVLRPCGLDLHGLTAKEIEVLTLLADGLTTRQLAAKLCCSERTVKGTIHEVVTRLKLSNRTHAVAYALRSGVLLAASLPFTYAFAPCCERPFSRGRFSHVVAGCRTAILRC
jgi:DNA-binding NarL/FixJ family response regulator